MNGWTDADITTLRACFMNRDTAREIAIEMDRTVYDIEMVLGELFPQSVYGELYRCRRELAMTRSYLHG